jgi:hypothetical protein
MPQPPPTVIGFSGLLAPVSPQYRPTLADRTCQMVRSLQRADFWVSHRDVPTHALSDGQKWAYLLYFNLFGLELYWLLSGMYM